jgi:hypothetical protein
MSHMAQARRVGDVAVEDRGTVLGPFSSPWTRGLDDLACGTAGTDHAVMPESDKPDAATPRRWRTPQVPTDIVSGRPVDDVAQLYRADGFEVQVVDLDTNPIVDAVFNAGRIRLAARNGRVVQASQG